MWKNLLKLEMNISFDPEIPYLRNYFIDILIIHIYIYEVIHLSIRCNTRTLVTPYLSSYINMAHPPSC